MLKRVYSVEVVNENGTEKVLKAFQEYEDAKKYAMNHKEKLKENEYLNIIYTAYEFPNQKVIWTVGGWNEKGPLEKETFAHLGEAYDTFEDLIEDINIEYGYDRKTNIFHDVVKIDWVSENEIYGRYDVQNHCGEIFFKREILK